MSTLVPLGFQSLLSPSLGIQGLSWTPTVQTCGLLLQSHSEVGVGAGWGTRTGRTSEENATELAFLGLQADPAGETKIFCKKCTL